MNHQLKVLLVDDDELIRLMVGSWLQAAGYDVVSASNGMDGLNILPEQMPDVVVTDLSMPGMHGLEFCKRVRAISDVPIIVFSGRTETEGREASLKAGADAYALKTMHMTDFLDVVRRFAHAKPLGYARRCSRDSGGEETIRSAISPSISV